MPKAAATDAQSRWRSDQRAGAAILERHLLVRRAFDSLLDFHLSLLHSHFLDRSCAPILPGDLPQILFPPPHLLCSPPPFLRVESIRSRWPRLAHAACRGGTEDCSRLGHIWRKTMKLIPAAAAIMPAVALPRTVIRLSIFQILRKIYFSLYN